MKKEGESLPVCHFRLYTMTRIMYLWKLWLRSILKHATCTFIEVFEQQLLFVPLSSAYLIQPSDKLQQLAADSDRLIATLVEYLTDRPDENDDLVQEKHLIQFDRLRESVFQALASLGSSCEEIRLKIVSERNMMKCLSEALNGENVNIKITAMRCA